MANAYRDYALKYQLSDWTVFTATLPLQMSSMKVAARLTPVGQPGPPAGTLAAGSQGFLVRALPVAEALSPIGVTGDYLRYVPLQYRHCTIDFRRTFEDYQKNFPPRPGRRSIERSGNTPSTRAVRKFGQIDKC